MVPAGQGALLFESAMIHRSVFAERGFFFRFDFLFI